MNQWDDFAFTLHYGTNDVEAIRTMKRNQPKECCKQFLIDWLQSNRGDGPKKWSTLLNKLGEGRLNLDQATIDDITTKVKKL